MKNIVTGQLNDSLYPIMDGVGLVARNYAFWLNEKYGTGYCIGPHVPGFKDTEDFIKRFPTIPIPGNAPYRYGLPSTKGFYKTIDSIPFDIIHTHCPFVSGKIALHIKKKKHIPLITTFHSKYREDFKRAFKTNALADFAVNHIMKFYNQTDMVWVPNEPTIDVLRSYGFKGKIEVSINGTDLIAPTPSELSNLQQIGYKNTDTTKDDFVLLFVGQHRWEKNVKLMIDGLKEISDANHTFKAFFIGTGPEINEMKRMVSDYHLEKKVFFKGIIKDREILKSYYAIADMFMFPSLYDTASLVMREAAAFSVPTVLIKEASTAKGVEDGKNGFLIENSSSSFAKKIMYAIDHPEARIKAGKGALQTIYLPWEKVVDSVYDRYLKIIRDFN